jgi:hypothetical protein
MRLCHLECHSRFDLAAGGLNLDSRLESKALASSPEGSSSSDGIADTRGFLFCAFKTVRSLQTISTIVAYQLDVWALETAYKRKDRYGMLQYRHHDPPRRSH